MKKVLCGLVILGAVSAMAGLAAGRVPAREAQPAAQGEKTGKEAKPRLVTATKAVPAGSSFELAVHFQIDKGYHLYWAGQNDSGMPMSVELKLPEGWKAGAIQWPYPIRHEYGGDLVDHIYENQATLFIPIEVPKDAKPESSHEITAEVSWMVCKETCAIGSATLKTTIGISAVGAKPEATGDSELLAAARKRLPKPLPADGAAGSPKATLADGNLVIEAGKGKKLAFFPHEASVLFDDILKSCVGEGRLSMKLKKPSPDQKEVSGILRVAGEKPGDDEYFSVALPLSKVQPEPTKAGKP